VAESERVRKLALECLRLAADCRELARTVDDHRVRQRFLQMADEFTRLAEHGPDARA
jgi:hypothetical protein